mmetsp:Transcript_53254/g.167394  ORF Transcript_53254/g.167394 Transcript_53254/m.167394 type:complete len:214 (-) Transcript_53254:239-880(-)
MAHRHQPCPITEQTLKLSAVQNPFRRYADEAELCADRLSELLPGHKVGVVLHDGEDDLIACSHVGGAPAASHEVDGLGSVPREDDLHGIGRANEPSHLLAGPLKGLSRADGERVHAAVDITVVLAVKPLQLCQHTLRLLGGCRVVQVDEGHTGPHLLSQRGELPADPLHLEGSGNSLRLSSPGNWPSSTTPPASSPAVPAGQDAQRHGGEGRR